MDRHETWILETSLTTISIEKWQTSVNLLARLFQTPTCCILQRKHEGFQIVTASQDEDNPYRIGGLIPPDSHTLHDQVLNEWRDLYIPNAIEHPYWTEFQEISADGFASYFGVPLQWPNGLPFGVLCILNVHATDYREPYFELVGTFKSQLESDLQLLVNEHELSELSLTDNLTGIYNRRGFDALAQYKLSVAKRYGHIFGLMYFDLDNLDAINNQLGRETGDQALMTMASALDSELRDSDIAARIGDDKFAALVFIQHEQDLENLATRIQKKMNLLKQQRDTLPPITSSVGAKCYQADTSLDIDTMLHEVDRLMFNIKHQKKLASLSGYSPKH